MTTASAAPARSRVADSEATRRVLTPWALATAVLIGQAMASLDSAIVNVAGPAIQRDLRLSGPALQLAIYSYLVAYGAGLVTGARLGDRYGFGRMFTWGVAIFTVSSLACGLAISPAMLVTARSVQGAGAALLVPQVLSLLQVTFTGEGRRRALSAYGAASFSGVLATINQLPMVTGIAVAGTIYLSAGRFTALPAMSVVLLALASAPVVTGTAVSVVDARARRAGRRHEQAHG